LGFQIIQVTFSASCDEDELPNDDEAPGGEYITARMQKRTDAKRGERKKSRTRGAAKKRGQTVCDCSVSVSLDANTTAGLTISEVALGNDTFATNIGVGNRESWLEFCDPADCEEKAGSAKIVDANGNWVATIGGFKVCRCRA